MFTYCRAVWCSGATYHLSGRQAHLLHNGNSRWTSLSCYFCVHKLLATHVKSDTRLFWMLAVWNHTARWHHNTYVLYCTKRRWREGHSCVITVWKGLLLFQAFCFKPTRASADLANSDLYIWSRLSVTVNFESSSCKPLSTDLKRIYLWKVGVVFTIWVM